MQALLPSQVEGLVLYMQAEPPEKQGGERLRRHPSPISIDCLENGCKLFRDWKSILALTFCGRHWGLRVSLLPALYLRKY